jgi:glycosyltransferase involved in cell wall biosynthesis
VVYHLHDPELLLVGIALKLLARASVVYDVHEDYPLQVLAKSWIPRSLRPVVAGLVRFLEPLAARQFDAVVTAGEDIARRFHKKASIIHNYPILYHDGNGAPPLRLARECLALIYIGGISRERGAIEMIKAMRLLPDSVTLTLVGRFSDPSLQEQVESMSGARRVRFLGWLPQREVQVHLGKADVGLVCFHPSPNHMFPRSNKLFEYMEAGLPVVASDFPLWRAIIEEVGCGLLVDPQDPGAIASAISRLRDSPEERKRMGDNGRKAVLERYNWEREGAILLELYEELVSEHR